MAKTKPVRRVILHAGLPKTATTTIQNACFAQRADLLDRHGILYPGDQPNHTNALCTAFLTDPRNHIANKMAGRTDLAELKEMAAAIRDRLEAQIREAAPEIVLFSAEGLSNLSAAELGDFRDWVMGFAGALEVFYILRNPLSYTASVIQQHLKGGEVLEDQYDALPLPHFKGRLSAAVQAFGTETVSAHTFEEMCTDPDGIVGAFLTRIGVEDGMVRQAILDGQARDNESLSHEAARILSSLNRQRPAFVDGHWGPRRTMNELATIQTIKGDKFRLPREVVARALEQSREDIDWARELFGITAYDGLAMPEDGPERETLPQETVDSLALTLSNLLNDRHVNTLINRARVLHGQGRRSELPGLARDIQRIAPDRPLPDFLARALEPVSQAGE